MKTMKQIASIIVASAFIAFGLTSCEKYEEGGTVRKGDERIINTWKLQSYLRNGTDETSSVYIKNYTEQYLENGTLTRSYTEKDGDAFSESGKYEFKNENKEVHISGVSSISDFSDQHSSLSTSTLYITKLTKDEYWYYFENGGDKHEFRFTK